MAALTVTVPETPTSADLAAMAALHAASFDDAWSAETLASMAAATGGVTVLATRDDALAGFALIRATLDEAEILTLCIAPDIRRRGIGLALVTGACAYCAGLGVLRLYLEVSVENEPAIALYARAGFAIIGRRRGYYRPAAGGPAVDALALAATLEQGRSGPKRHGV